MDILIFLIFSLVYVTMSQGNDGVQGLQSGGSPAISSGVMSVASIDNSRVPQLYLLTPNGEEIFYSAGVIFGGSSHKRIKLRYV